MSCYRLFYRCAVDFTVPVVTCITLTHTYTPDEPTIHLFWFRVRLYSPYLPIITYIRDGVVT